MPSRPLGPSIVPPPTRLPGPPPIDNDRVSRIVDHLDSRVVIVQPTSRITPAAEDAVASGPAPGRWSDLSTLTSLFCTRGGGRRADSRTRFPAPSVGAPSAPPAPGCWRPLLGLSHGSGLEAGRVAPGIGGGGGRAGFASGCGKGGGISRAGGSSSGWS